MPLWRRNPILPTAITIAVLISGGYAVQPIRDAATKADMTEVVLQRSTGYVALAPVSGVLDTLTLISARQHLALLAGVLVLFALWRGFRAWRGTSSLRQHGAATAVLFLVILAVYAAGALLPRPMAALAADNANLVKVDFHSHTSASHDGHQRVEALREWHRRAGFDVAYVTDHATVSAAEQGHANNPRPAGLGVTLLQSIETTWDGEHVSIPGAQRDYGGLLTANLADVDTQSLRMASVIRGREPIVIWNHPRNVTRLPLAPHPQTAGVRAIELVNGAPKDIDNLRANHEQLVAMASGADLALVAGSDNHGFGYVTPGWTVMLLVDWRGMSPDVLSRGIERILRDGRFRATRVVERRIAEPATGVQLAATVFTVPARMLTTLSNDERIVWLLWTWLIVVVGRLVRPRLRSTA